MIRETMLAFTLVAGSNAADVVSARSAIRAGGREYQAAWLYGQRAERIVPMKLVVVAAEVGVYKAIRKESKKAAWCWVAGVVAANLYVAHRKRGVRAALEGGAR
jgi:hypothetical protein